MTTPTTALALPAEITKVSFKTDIERWAPQIQQVAYKGFTPDRVFGAALYAAVKDPKLFEATPESLYLALTRVARWGLDIGDTVHLVPLSTKVKRQGEDVWVTTAEAWPDYKGLKALARRQRIINHMDEFCVYEKDHFEYELGLNERLIHRPAPAATRGKLIGAYSIIRLPFGTKTFHFMPLEDIEKIRKTSRTWAPKVRDGKTLNGECPDWYAMKTVVRDYLSRQPKLGALAEALSSDDTAVPFDPETGEILTPVPAARRIEERPAALDQRTPADDELDQRLDGEEQG